MGLLSPEIWNIGVVSMVLMLVYAAMNPAMAILNTTLDDSDSNLSAAVGYTNESIMSIVSIVGALLTPSIQALIGSRMTISIAALLHVGLYVGVIMLNEWLIYIGSIISGLAMGMIWVAVPNFVTLTSQHKNIERNMSYHMFAYTLNGMAGGLLNYFCLQDTEQISSTSRITYFSACCIVTVLAVLISLVGLRPTPVRSKSSQDIIHADEFNLISNDELDGMADKGIILEDVELSNRDQETRPNNKDSSLRARFVMFALEPAVVAACATNVYFGFVTTLLVIIPTCIGNTYENRYLIPLIGIVLGVTRFCLTGLWHQISRMLGYHTLVNMYTLLSVIWALLVFMVFAQDSSHNSNSASLAVYPTGEWVVYPLGVLSGCCITGMTLLWAVTTGKVSKDPKTMHGFDSSTLFSYTMVIWSISSTVTFAITPFISLYLFLLIMFVLLVITHFSFTFQLLDYVS